MGGITCVYLFMCSLILLVNQIEPRELKHRATLTERVRPVVLHGRTRRELSTTRHDEGNTHHPEVIVAVDIGGEEYILELELNHGLLPEGHTISYQDGEKTILHKPKKEEIELCQYTGHVRGKPNSRVALSTCHGLRGIIHDGDRIRYIDPAEGSSLQSLHLVYEHTDTETEHKCGTEGQGFEDKPEPESSGGRSGTRRNRHIRSLVPPSPFNEESLYVELVIVADHAQYVGANKNLSALHHQLLETVNILNVFYAPLNIFVALSGVDVWTTGDKITLDVVSSKTLKRFSDYQNDFLFDTVGPHDHAQLITSTSFEGGIVGLAYVSTICKQRLSCGFIYKDSHDATAAHLTRDAKVMAHEMGHTFGMGHDDHTCSCPAKHCFQGNAVQATHWSDCNTKLLKDKTSEGKYNCLRNKPRSLFGAPTCGNGFIEPGEDCDCGVSVEGVPAYPCPACCDPKTCRMLWLTCDVDFSEPDNEIN